MTGAEPIRPDVRAALGIPWTGAYPHPTIVMGIVNVTPDSFQPEGRYMDVEGAVSHALKLVEEGADILDIGGESTRPGSETVSEEAEANRVVPVIRAIASVCDVPISIDTRKAAVAEQALDAGARIVNDISAGRYDSRMFRVAAERNAFLCLMHAPLDIAAMKWSPDEPGMGEDTIVTVSRYLEERALAAQEAGVRPDRIWLDPGFGFGKSVDDNLAIVRGLHRLAQLGRPLLLGVSRKSTLGMLLGGVPPEERVEASLAAAAVSAGNGASILRVHDVQATVRATIVADAILHQR